MDSSCRTRLCGFGPAVKRIGITDQLLVEIKGTLGPRLDHEQIHHKGHEHFDRRRQHLDFELILLPRDAPERGRDRGSVSVEQQISRRNDEALPSYS